MVERKRGRRGCRGCLGCLGGLVLLGGGLLLALIFAGPLLHAIGLAGPSAEELYSGAPDPVATEAVNGALDAEGIAGVDAWVIPIQGEEGQIAILSFDGQATAGGTQSVDEAESVFLDTVRQLSQANREEALGIELVAVDYRDETGENLLAFAADQAAIDAYASGEITRRQFLAQVDVDFSNLISAEELRALAEEAR
jgi:hypothetical protein